MALLPLEAPLWLRLALLGFLLNMKPSEPFLTDYLLNVKNFTDTELAVDVWPWSTFGAFIFLLPFGVLAELIGSRAVIFIGILCREVTRVMLIYSSSLSAMAIMQIAYGAGVAGDAIYFAYVFAVAPPSQYAWLTSVVLAAYHAGNVIGAVAGQCLVWTLPSWAADETPLFFISWTTVSLGLVAFWWLPPAARALPPSLASVLLKTGPRATLVELAKLWRPLESRRWLLWFLLAGPGDAVIGNYFQLQLAQTSAADVPYGALEAAIELGLVCGALLAVPAARLVRTYPSTFLFWTSLCRAAALCLAALGASARIAWIPFALNVVASAIYALQRAAGSSAIAAAVVASADRLPVLFAANTFVACVGAAALGWAGAMLGWEAANNYYYTAAALMVALAVFSPAVSLLAGARSSGEEGSLLIVAPTMLDPTPTTCSDACHADSSINSSTSTHPVEACTHACTSTNA